MRTRSRAGRNGISGAIAVSLLLASAIGSGEPRDEYEVKAVFLYNFAKFVEWPQRHASSRLTIGVLGDDRFEALLRETIAGERVGSRQLVSRALSRDDALDDCDVVFVSGSLASETRAILERARGKFILTVGEADAFTEAGGIIGLHVVNSRVRFSVNLKAAERAQLGISSQLLKLASEIHETAP